MERSCLSDLKDLIAVDVESGLLSIGDCGYHSHPSKSHK